jgi:hypothetical protein
MARPTLEETVVILAQRPDGVGVADVAVLLAEHHRAGYRAEDPRDHQVAARRMLVRLVYYHQLRFEAERWYAVAEGI